jgi:hypothetical protein
MNDGTFTHTEEGQIKGMIVYFMKDGKPFYEYMPLYYSKDHRDIWYDEIMSKNNDLTWIKDIYWWLDEYSCVLVLRNKFLKFKIFGQLLRRKEKLDTNIVFLKNKIEDHVQIH